MKVVWTGDRLIAVTAVSDDETWTKQILTYWPEEDTWEIATFPDERIHIGAVVWSGNELLLVGGDHNAPDDTAWAFDPGTGEWRRLSDPPIDPVEELRGVWADDEAIFFGGYAGPQPSPAVAYDPRTDSWRSLPTAPSDWYYFNHLAWTGEALIVYSGHTGPGHPDRLLIYHPGTISWSESSPMPMLPAERLAGAWTGDRLIIWGGYATYGQHDEDGDAVFGHGAMYDPVTDTWELMAPAPISDRCDHSGTWTGTEFIVFGGMPLCGTPGILPLGDGAAYDPATDGWRLLEK